jgi:hypothetical protein
MAAPSSQQRSSTRPGVAQSLVRMCIQRRLTSESCRARTVWRTATPVASRGTWWHSAVLSECEARFLNGRRRSVNRKVRSSNLRPGASFELKLRQSCPTEPWLQQPDSNGIATGPELAQGRDRAVRSSAYLGAQCPELDAVPSYGQSFCRFRYESSRTRSEHIRV